MPKWMTGDDVPVLHDVIGPHGYRRRGLFVDDRGNYYHSDETWSEVYGPFTSQDEAWAALGRYVKWLNGSKE